MWCGCGGDEQRYVCEQLGYYRCMTVERLGLKLQALDSRTPYLLHRHVAETGTFS